MGLLESYLKSMAYASREAGGKPNAAFPFITISRQAGAGGHSLAEALIRAMGREEEPAFRGWHIFDDELCVRILNDPKLRVSFRSLVAEEYHTEIENYFLQFLARMSPQYLVHKKTFQTVRTLALAGKAILIGRGAACYTRDIPGGLHLRLIAPEKTCVEVLGKRLGCSEAEARKTARERDDARRRLVKAYFRRDIDDPTLYDAVWNTGTVPSETIAALVVAWLKRQAKVPAAV